MGQQDYFQGVQGVDGSQGVQHVDGGQPSDGTQGVQGVEGAPTSGGMPIIPAACCSEGTCVDTPFVDYWVLEAACVTMMNGEIKMYKTCADNPCG